jgi:hypothetical protein
MSIIHLIPAIASALSRKKKSEGHSHVDMGMRIEMELQYGEICYECYEHIGDATGEARMCTKCKIKTNSLIFSSHEMLKVLDDYQIYCQLNYDSGSIPDAREWFINTYTG